MLSHFGYKGKLTSCSKPIYLWLERSERSKMRCTNWSRNHSMLVGKSQLQTVFLSPLGSFRTLPGFTCPLVLSPLRDHICQTASQRLFHAHVLYPALSPMFCLFADNLMCLSGLNASLFLEAFNSTT